jgi:cytochrome c-type protein NapB
MINADKSLGKVVFGFAALCLAGLLVARSSGAAPDIPRDFDVGGEKIFSRHDETPPAALSGTDGRRTLNTYYALRQYPGSPPRIPHAVPVFFRDDNEDCLACHGGGGYDAEQDAYAPVTPHPENENCFQCHVARRTEQRFAESDWQSVKPPKLGRSQLPGAPPPIPHVLQLREDCLACHAGPAAVAEIRVEHASRGNCRQCHVPLVSTEPPKEFLRPTEEPGQ